MSDSMRPKSNRPARRSSGTLAAAHLERAISKNGERGAHTIIRLPIAIIPCTPIDADNPGPVPIVVAAIVILVVMASIVISVIPSTVIISGSLRGNKADKTEHQSKR